MHKGLNFFALPDDRTVRLSLGPDGRAEVQRHNMLILPQDAKDYLARQADALWYPHPAGDQMSDAAWIVNNCTDPDTYSAPMDWLEQTFADRVPIFNPPSALAKSVRDRQVEIMGDIPGLVVPQVKRFTLETVSDLRRVFEEGGFSFPVLVRPNEHQAGLGLERIDSHDDWERVLYTRWYRKVHLMTQFVDTQTESGAYLKVRVTFIGGKPYIRHCKAATHWLVQGARNDLITENPALELELIDRIEANSAFMSVFGRIGGALDLDLFGADLGFDLETDRLVLFEANASMSMFFSLREGRSHEWLMRRKRLQQPAEEHLVAYIKDPSAWRSQANRGSR
jgi:hypothetical protein